MISVYHKDDAAVLFTHDPVFTKVLATPTLASQSSLSRFLQYFDAQEKNLTNFKWQSENYLSMFNIQTIEGAYFLLRFQSCQYIQKKNIHHSMNIFIRLSHLMDQPGDFLKADMLLGKVYLSLYFQYWRRFYVPTH